MSKSQNGWPVVAKAACDQGPFLGVTFPNGILAGDVAVIARWQMGRYEATVEPLIKGACWGWYVKPIEGTATASNHSSATAWDINATKYPMGDAASEHMSAAKINACKAIVAASGGVLRWGGTYSGRPDPMHWEIVGTPAEAHTFANKIRVGGRTPAMATISGELPVQVQGDEDQPNATQWIKRAQAELNYLVGAGLDLDGDYGPATAAAVKDLMSEDSTRSSTNGSKIGIPEWRRLYGIWS